MALAITNRGAVTAGAASNATRTATSASFTPAAGSIVVAAASGYWGTNTQLSYVASDTFGDTGGTAWAQVARGGQIHSGVESMETSIWARVIGTGASAGTITATRGVGTTYWSTVLQCSEITGGNTTTPSGAIGSNTTTSGTTLLITLSGSPASTSLVLTVIHGAGVGTPTATVPAGYTALNNDNFDTEQHASAYLNGSAASTLTWATGAAAFALDACAAEFLVAPSGGVVVPVFVHHRRMIGAA